MKKKLKQIISFLANPRLILCWLIAWLITNGWSYIALGVGLYFDIVWLKAIASSYLAFLWLPISPEKLVTLAISLALLRFLFPDDEHTLGVLRKLHADAKSKAKSWCLRKRKTKSEEISSESKVISADAEDSLPDLKDTSAD